MYLFSELFGDITEFLHFIHHLTKKIEDIVAFSHTYINFHNLITFITHNFYY